MQELPRHRICNLQAEAAVISCLIADPIKCLASGVQVRLKPDQFGDAQCKIIYRVLVETWQAKGEIDGLLLRSALEAQGLLEQVGGLDRLSAIIESMPVPSNVQYYADLVCECARYRKVVQFLDESDKLLQSSDSAAEIADKIQKLIAIASARADIHVADESSVVDAALSVQSGAALIPTGYQALDNMVGGYGYGDVVIIGGRPGAAKSSLATCLALRACTGDTRVIYSTLEMSCEQTWQRAVAAQGGHDFFTIRRRYANDDQLSAYQATALALQSAAKLTVVDGLSTPAQLGGFISQQKQRGPVGMVIVDHIQLMRSGGATKSRYEDMTEISRALKQLAIKERVIMIELCQLSRGVEQRENKRPVMSDLRDSGGNEENADQVWLMYRDDYYHKNEDGYALTGVCEIDIAKQRNGPTGRAMLRFLPASFGFEDIVDGLRG